MGKAKRIKAERAAKQRESRQREPLELVKRMVNVGRQSLQECSW
jgi:hypothetical protein